MIQPIPTVPRRRRKSLWLWVMLILLALSVLLVVRAFNWLASFEGAPVHIAINGTDIADLDIGALTGWDRVGVQVAAVIAVFAVLVVIPIVLMICLAAVVLGVLLGIALPLLVALLAVVLVLSPVWAVAAFVWWLIRRSDTPAGIRAA